MEPNKVDTITQKLLKGLISHNDRKARAHTRKEIIDKYNHVYGKNINVVPITCTIKIILKTPTNYHLWINVEGSKTLPQTTESRLKGFESFYEEDPALSFSLEEIGRNGFNIEIKLINDNAPNLLCNTLRSFSSIVYNVQSGLVGNGMEKLQFEVSRTLNDINDFELGKIDFQISLEPIPHFGIKYWKRLPVFDPDTKIPALAMPSPGFVEHDEFNEMIVAFVIIYWMLRGEKHAWDMLPPNVYTRSDFATSDEFFVYRRLNGCNRPYNFFKKVEGKEWDYEMRLSFSGYEIRKDVWLPDNTCCNFKLVDDQLVIVNVQYQMKPDGPVITQLADGSPEWNEFKIKYMMIEFNYNITWAHVGVHFIVEMYNMAFYRNIIRNPIKKLLYPHFDGVIFNNWLVVRPMYNGVVTLAAALTYEGQVQMLTEKFKHMTYRWKPNPLPSNIKNNTYDEADLAAWKLIGEYVDDFISHNKVEINQHWSEIVAVSKDLVDHQLNEDPKANSIETMEELRDCCVFIIYQAVFRHAWIHWKAWDDESQAILYNKDGETSLKDIIYHQNLGNAIEAGVQYPSAYVRHYPILDHEFGGPEFLQRKLWENAHKINPGISIGSLVMSPNI
ncbi:hypothetical protein PPL_00554 [Heterostelium album PN500]|uniref:Lipoxygenase domain-containing protein n=1 Tax=Heterostelium pallidum (strain ATCC 26659 / Pp 5 / PN500) TaxID=670386 RepID=D3AWS6_HETP5|nr:hypothetical protein PPL_00554 [Heterostelium album PN500]EFA86749.1 hypothetical protein PPL_00554 [Heterostelium album PN500]|eukprot:XP_020438853.1 hypothetical protein PPL_00554 [Heterostelium album PN500]